MSKKVPNYNSCIFCLRSIHLYPGISLHQFPKDQSIRIKWLEACGYSESDVYPKRKLCSIHFESNCYTGLHKKVLKRGAIPTLHFKKKRKKPVTVELLNCEPPSRSVHNNSVPSQPTSSSTTLEKHDLSHQNIISVPPSPILVTFKTENNEEILKCKHDLNQGKLMSEPSSSILDISDTQRNEVSDTPKRKKRKSFIGYIATPRRATRVLHMAKFQIMAQRRKIKVLNKTVRRQKKKLLSLEALFKYLKTKNLLTEAAHDFILEKNIFI